MREQERFGRQELAAETEQQALIIPAQMGPCTVQKNQIQRGYIAEYAATQNVIGCEIRSI
jgi:hypothetical protein